MEKHKERKHKKEKSVQEKKEGKRKGDKYRSKEKHRKHDQKDKHKKKYKCRDEDITRTPEVPAEKNNKTQQEQECQRRSQKGEEIHKSKLNEELDRRIRDEEKGTINQMIKSFGCSLQSDLEKYTTAAFAGRLAVGYNSTNSIVQLKTERIVKQINSSRISSQREIEGPGYGTSICRETSIIDQLVIRLSSPRASGNNLEDRKLEGTFRPSQRILDDGCIGGKREVVNKIAPGNIYTSQRPNVVKDHSAVSFPGFCDGKCEGMGPAVALEEDGEDINRRFTNFCWHAEDNGLVQCTDKVLEIGSNQKEKSKDVGGQYKKRKKCSEAKPERKEKDKHKMEEKKIINAKENSEHKCERKDKLTGSSKMDQVACEDTRSAHLQKESEKNIGADGSTKKREDFEMNSVFHEHNVRPSKISRANPPFLLAESNENLQQFHALPAAGWPCGMASDNIKGERVVDSKQQKGHNISAQFAPNDLRLPALVSVENFDNFKKIPHPDEEHLSQVYSVPQTMDEWPEFDDQDWLFGGCCVRLKPNKGIGVNETLIVWMEPIPIESADIIALPYVIPF